MMGAVMAMVLPLELDDGRLDQLLGMWAKWMSGHEHLRELWYPDGACGCVGGGYSLTFDDMLDMADARTVEGVNGAIESLSPAEQCAVTYVHLYAVYRFRDLKKTYLDARTALKLGLPARGIY